MNCHVAIQFLLNSAGTVKWSEVDKEDVAVTGNVAYGAVSHDGQIHDQGHEYEIVESLPQTGAAAGPQEATYEVVAVN